jgi:hypothetical protein
VGLFIYEVIVSGSVNYPGMFEIRSNDNDDIKSDTAGIKTNTDNLPADPASETNVDSNEAKIDLLQTDVTAVLADTNETQGKLPDNNIMGSSVKSDKDDEIDSIKSTVEAINVENFNGSEDTA